ncbi:MAG: SDR family NAD(P)-dependent oxidoreductase, partial [Lysobacter spongiicola]|nr:SDR family NAD(P)-dependent oxidoreductase [Lysobacter spongiicola]
MHRTPAMHRCSDFAPTHSSDCRARGTPPASGLRVSSRRSAAGMGATLVHPVPRPITRCRCRARRVRGMVRTQPTTRIAVVTGASAGVGRASAIEFARHGWRVALLARGRDGLEGAKAEVEAAG